MEHNHLQPNHTYTAPNTYKAPFGSKLAYKAGQAETQAAAQAQARPVPPLANAADLATQPAARALQAYSAISTRPLA